MAGFRRTVHPQADIVWGKMADIAPDIVVNQPDANGSEAMGLAFMDPDGEQHVYVFSDLGRENLIRQLTGGVIVPATMH